MSFFRRKRLYKLFAGVGFLCLIYTVVFTNYVLPNGKQKSEFTQGKYVNVKPEVDDIVGINVFKPRVLSRKDNYIADELHTSKEKDEISQRVQITHTHVNISQYPYEVDRCPVCYGTSVCDLVEDGHITLNTSNIANDNPGGKDTYSGHFNSLKIVGKGFLTNLEVKKFYGFLANCYTNLNKDSVTDNHATGIGKKCKFFEELVNSFRSNEIGTSNYAGFRKSNEQYSFGKRSITSKFCMSQRFLDTVWKVYQVKEPTTTPAVTIISHLITAFILNPDALLLKFFSSFDKIFWPFPRYFGECGNVIITEDAGAPLYQSFKADWKERARLALRLLDMIYALQRLSSDWLLLPTNMNVHNFVVAPSGRLVMLNLDDIVILDKSETDQAYWGQNKTVQLKYLGGKPCNHDCLTEFSMNLATEPEKYCPLVMEYADFSYASACLELFTDHGQASRIDKSQNLLSNISIETGGLLHDPPGEIKNRLTYAISKCIKETVRGERLDAVESIRRTLQF
ncbi:divergent protein kinase domain 2B-like [Glandiceps talaboti]